MAEETTPTTSPTEDGIPAGIDPAFWQIGKEAYATCTACHQANGEGLPGAFPPLAASEWVVGPVENLIRMQLRGLTGEITVKGQTYNSVMPPMAYQTDEQVAAVLTYVRNTFGNSAAAVSPEEVAEYRDEVGQPMLTVADLIDPFSVKAVETNSSGPVELAPALDSSIKMPPAASNFNFPLAPLAAIFLLIVFSVAGKFILGKKG